MHLLVYMLFFTALSWLVVTSPEHPAAGGGDACWSHGCSAGGSAAARTGATGTIAGHSSGPQCDQWGDSDGSDLNQHGAERDEQSAATGGLAAAVD